jgi:ornithine carbamoyltransferase
LTGVNPVGARIRTLAAVKSHPPSPALRALAPGALLSATTAEPLLDIARRLRTAAVGGQPAPAMLHGKNLAVLQVTDSPAMSAMHQAAVDLGVRVSRVSLGEPPPPVVALARIAGMLGRMYDAIDVGTLAPAAASELAIHAGVPVYRGLADGSHPMLTLELDGDPATDRRFLLQALLLATIG